MFDHPSSFQLEALSVGETNPEVSNHAKDCTDCQTILRALEADRQSFLERRDPGRFARALRIRESKEKRHWSWPKIWLLAPALAAATAAFVLFVNVDRNGTGGVYPGNIRLKGDAQLAVVRLRAGEQSKHTGQVTVRPKDRLRFVVTLPKAQKISVAVLVPNDAPVFLLREKSLPAGTHALEQAFAVDEARFSGRVVAGAYEDVKRAAEGVSVASLTSLAIRFEAEP